MVSAPTPNSTRESTQFFGELPSRIEGFLKDQARLLVIVVLVILVGAASLLWWQHQRVIAQRRLSEQLSDVWRTFAQTMQAVSKATTSDVEPALNSQETNQVVHNRATALQHMRQQLLNLQPQLVRNTAMLPVAQLLQATTALEANDSAAAEPLLLAASTQLTAGSPWHFMMTEQLANLREDKHQFDDALTLLAAASGDEGQFATPYLQYHQVLLLIAQKQFNKARGILEHLLQIYPNSALNSEMTTALQSLPPKS